VRSRAEREESFAVADVLEHVEGVDGGVVVGVDGSAESQVALRRAAEEAVAHELDLHVVRAWTITKAPHPASRKHGYVPSYSEFEAVVREEVDREVTEALGAKPPCTVHVHPVRGSAAKKLIEASKSAGLMVVGSRGLGGFAGLVLGSTSEQVVRHAKCPVLVVRNPSPE
jgi:nucleotide-binding universal stress UspA family protein